MKLKLNMAIDTWFEVWLIIGIILAVRTTSIAPLMTLAMVVASHKTRN